MKLSESFRKRLKYAKPGVVCKRPVIVKIRTASNLCCRGCMFKVSGTCAWNEEFFREYPDIANFSERLDKIRNYKPCYTEGVACATFKLAEDVIGE